MNAQADPQVLGNRSYFSKESEQIGAEIGGSDPVVFGQLAAKRFAVIGSLGAGQARDYGLLDIDPARLRHRLETRSRRSNLIGVILDFRVYSLEDEDVIGGKVDGVKAQSVAGRMQRPFQVSAGPIHY